MEQTMYSIKMRASKSTENDTHPQHISGAEKIISEDKMETICSQLIQRALHHAKGDADFINLKIEKIDPCEILTQNALPVTTIEVNNALEGRNKLLELMEQNQIHRSKEILSMMRDTWNMRGAMLLNVDTLERMEPDKSRGIRATYMDILDDLDNRTTKNHFKEAVVLATKVASHPNIVGELCISDDPDYVTGYFASRQFGYVRITKLKEMGCPDGGRIFLFRGNQEDALECIHYLEKQKMLVKFNSSNAGGAK